MTLKNLLCTMNFQNQVRIYTTGKTKTDLVLIFKGTSNNAIKYFKGCDKKMYSVVDFINLAMENEIKAPFIQIVIE